MSVIFPSANEGSKDKKKSIRKRLSDAYFVPKNFEKHGNGKIYEQLGIKTYQKIVLETAGKLLKTLSPGINNHSNSYFIGEHIDEHTLRTFEKGTRFNELVHVVQIPLDLAIFSLFASNGDHSIQSGVFLALTVLNTYSVMMQRYNRTRLYAIFKKRYGQ